MATRYRDLQGPSLIQTGLTDSSAAQTAARLADTFKSFESTAGSIGGKLVGQVGARYGAIEGAAGVPQPKTGMAAMTSYGAAYNQAAEVTYTNKIQTDLTTELARIEQAAGTDTTKYSTLSKAYVEGTVKGAPEAWQTQVEQMVAPQIAAGSVRVAKMAHLQQLDEAAASYEEWAPTAIDQFVKDTAGLPPDQADAQMKVLVGDSLSKLQTLHDTGAISATEYVKLKGQFVDGLDKALAESHITGAVSDLNDIARVNVEKGDAAFAQMMNRTDLTDAEKAKAGSLYREGIGLLVFERSRQYLAETTALSKALANGESGLDGQARRLYQKGALTPEGYQSAIDQSTHNGKVQAEKQAATIDIGAKLQSGATFDPGDSETRKAANVYFDETAKNNNMLPGDPNWQALALTMAHQGIVPEPAMSWVRSSMVSSNQLAVAEAARFYDKARDANPVAFSWNDEPKLAVTATMVNDRVEAGNNSDEAVVAAVDDVNRLLDIKSGTKDIREKDYAALTKKDTNDEFLRSAYDAKDVGDLPASMRAEFDQAVRDNFALGASLDVARRTAAKQIKVWGTTVVNGQPQIVKYPVEAQGYRPDVIRADIAAAGLPLGVDLNNVHLVPSRNTDRTRGQIWALGTTDEYGSPTLVHGANYLPLEYQVPNGHDYVALRNAVDMAKARDALALEKEIQKAQQEIAQQNPFPVLGKVR